MRIVIIIMLRFVGIKSQYTGMSFISRTRLLHQKPSLPNKSHYDALGITPKATQNDIKAAYYKLSLKFHPDKNDGSEAAATKFREITEAYEILSNSVKKETYDRKSADDKFEESYERYMRAQNIKHKQYERTRPPPTWRTDKYNFEEYYKMHYGRTFTDEKMRQREAYRRGINMRKRMKFYLIGIPLTYLFIFLTIEMSDMDRYTYRYSNREKDSSDRT